MDRFLLANLSMIAIFLVASASFFDQSYPFPSSPPLVDVSFHSYLPGFIPTSSISLQDGLFVIGYPVDHPTSFHLYKLDRDSGFVPVSLHLFVDSYSAIILAASETVLLIYVYGYTDSGQEIEELFFYSIETGSEQSRVAMSLVTGGNGVPKAAYFNDRFYVISVQDSLGSLLILQYDKNGNLLNRNLLLEGHVDMLSVQFVSHGRSLFILAETGDSILKGEIVQDLNEMTFTSLYFLEGQDLSANFSTESDIYHFSMNTNHSLVTELEGLDYRYTFYRDYAATHSFIRNERLVPASSFGSTDIIVPSVALFDSVSFIPLWETSLFQFDRNTLPTKGIQTIGVIVDWNSGSAQLIHVGLATEVDEAFPDFIMTISWYNGTWFLIAHRRASTSFARVGMATYVLTAEMQDSGVMLPFGLDQLLLASSGLLVIIAIKQTYKKRGETSDRSTYPDH